MQKEAAMKNRFAARFTCKAEVLEDILSGEITDRTTRECLESLRGEVCRTEELEAIALILTMLQKQW